MMNFFVELFYTENPVIYFQNFKKERDSLEIPLKGF